MLRGLAVLLVQLLITPPLALAGIAVHLARPRAEAIPRVGQIWARIVLRVGGIRLRLLGVEHVAETRPAVLVGNHASDIDTFAAALAISRPFRFVAKRSLFRIPFFGQAMWAAGFVPLDRSGGGDDIERLQRLRADLDRGAVVVFFPEGTRSRDGRLGRFRKGAFVTAIEAQVPIVPMVVRGAHHRRPPRSIRYVPGTLEVEFLPPIPTSGLSYDDRDTLLERTRDAFVRALPADQRPRDPGGPAA